jgi:hypothetical protein
MIKHKVFSWLLFVEGVNTRDMLERQNFFIGHDFSSLLYVCRLKTKQDVTSFFQCSFSAYLLGCDLDSMGLELASSRDVDLDSMGLELASLNVLSVPICWDVI